MGLRSKLPRSPEPPQRDHPGVLPAIGKHAGDASGPHFVQHVLEGALRGRRGQDGAEHGGRCRLP
eukprot:scaffold597155_cov23-Prasinocladus_malaysianus.AAC.1